MSVWVTLVPHRIGEFGQVGQQFSLQAYWCQTEASEQRLGSQTVLAVLTKTTSVLSTLLSLNTMGFFFQTMQEQIRISLTTLSS